jgi:hypothetical protein
LVQILLIFVFFVYESTMYRYSPQKIGQSSNGVVGELTKPCQGILCHRNHTIALNYVCKIATLGFDKNEQLQIWFAASLFKPKHINGIALNSSN